MKKIFLIILLILQISFAKAQTRYFPKIGSVIDDVNLTEVKYYAKSALNLKDFRGKWLILDFWNDHCTSCIESFSKTDSLQKEFIGKVQFLLIGNTGSLMGNKPSYKNIHSLYEKVRKRNNLNLSVAYDSLLFQKFGISACPLIIVIDPLGVVKGITTEIGRDDIRCFLAGRSPDLSPTMYDQNYFIPYSREQPFLTNGNGGNDTNFIYRSLLTIWNNKLPKIFPDNVNELAKKGRFEAIGAPLSWLYKLAYMGKVPFENEDFTFQYVDYIIYRTRDSLLLKTKPFCYSLSFPSTKANQRDIMTLIQKDLDSYFGYKITTETRTVVYYRAVMNDHSQQRLATKGGKTYWYEIGANGLKADNISMKELLDALYSYQRDKSFLIADDNITKNIDIVIDVQMNDFNAVKKALLSQGINLEKGEKQMKVLVISDPEKGL